MSEIGWYKSRLSVVASARAYTANIEESPLFQMLQRAVGMVAQQHNGTLAQAVSDYYGQETGCDLAVIVPEFKRGVGIKVDRQTGAVSFVYDSYGGYAEIAQDIADEITQSYSAIALIRAMKSLGYEVKEEPARPGQKTVALTGVMW